MNKVLKSFGLIIIIMITLTACGKDKKSSSFLSIPETALQGEIDGVEFGIGDSTEDIVNLWGNPNNYDYFMGGLYFIYNDVNEMYYTSAVRKGETIEHGHVMIIALYEEGNTYFGVTIGESFRDIESKIGKARAFISPEEHEGNELFSNSWVAYYDAGDYEIAFASSNEEGPIHSIFLYIKE